MEVFNKMALYLQAATVLRSPHWTGFPLLPKSACASLPYSRAAYNSFIIWIKRLALPSAQVIVDVGANHGDFANAASTCFPKAKVMLVEPLPKMQLCLDKIIRDQHKKWRLMKCALGAEPGTLPLFVDEAHDDISSLVGFSPEYLKANPRAQSSEKLVCEVSTLDKIAAEAKIDRIDLLKIDVEGFEFEVIKGAAQILGKTCAVIVEVSLVRQTGKTSLLVEMLRLLTNHGFEVINVIPSLFDPQETWRPREFNILARRS
ncbi:MAG TPA: FkbM family methyltransferase [Verrucomicrobiae bacterium]|jgi:FkbM family methyltransferase